MNGFWLISYVALWALVIALAIVVLGLVRQLGVIHLRLGPDGNVTTTTEGLALGSAAPDFRATDVIRKQEVTLAGVRRRPTIMVFVSPWCRPCLELIPHLIKFYRHWSKQVNLVVVSQASAEDTAELAATHKLPMVVVADAAKTISEAYLVRATPFAYRLDKDGKVQRRGIVNDLDALEALLEDVSPSELTIELPLVVVTTPQDVAAQERAGGG